MTQRLRLLLLVGFLLCTCPAWAQDYKQVPASKQQYKNDAQRLYRQHRTPESVANAMQAPGNNGPSIGSAGSQSSAKTAGVNTIQIGSASNPYSIISNRTNQIVIDENSDFVGFIHRQNRNIWGDGGQDPTVSNGIYRMDYSLDNGSTWPDSSIDVGPLAPVPYNNASRCRYPQVAISNPTGSSNPDDLEFSFLGPTTDGTGWGNYVYGAFTNITQIPKAGPSTQPQDVTYDFLSDNQNNGVFIPGGWTEGAPGEYWAADANFDNGTDNQLDSIFIYKGTRVSADSINIQRYRSFFAGNFVGGDPGSPQTDDYRHSRHNIAFSPDGKWGWMAFTGDYTLNQSTEHRELDPIFFYSNDSGQTWQGPISPHLRDYDVITDSILTEFVNQQGQVVDTSSGIPFAGGFDLTVDKDGNPHMLLNVSNWSAIELPNGQPDPDSLDFISTGAAKAVYDITTDNQGKSWCPVFVSAVNAFQGNVVGDLDIGTHPQIARDTDGEHVFYSWVDDTASQSAQVMDPNMYNAAMRVDDRAMTPVESKTVGDPNWDGILYFPQTGTEVTEVSANTYKLHTVFLEPGGGELQSVNFHYIADSLTFQSSDFMDQPFDAAVTSLTPANDTICGGATPTKDYTMTVENMGTRAIDTLDITLDITGARDTTISRVEVSNITPGNSQNFTFSGIDISLSGTYNVTASVSVANDFICRNNSQQSITVNVGGSSQQILTQDSIEACGTLLLDSGIEGVQSFWRTIAMNPDTLSSNSTATVDSTNLSLNSWEDIEVTVDANSTVCTSPIKDTVSVRIRPLPPLTISGTDTAICLSQAPLTFDADTIGAGNPEFNYSWSINDTGVVNQRTLSLNSQGNYDLVVEDSSAATGCVNSAAFNAKIWDVDLAQSNLDTISNSYCGEQGIDAGNITTLAGSEFEWFVSSEPGGSTADSAFAGNVDRIDLLGGVRTYKVVVEDPLGCSIDSASFTTARYDTLSEENIDATLSDCNGLARSPGDVSEIGFKTGVADTFRVNVQTAANGDSLRIDEGDTLTPYTGFTWRIFRPSYIDSWSCPSNYNCTSNTSGQFLEISGSPVVYVQFNSSADGSPITANVRVESGSCSLQPVSDLFQASGKEYEACFTDRQDPKLSAESLSVFPNPSKDVFNYSLELRQGSEAQLQVYDMMGRNIQTRSISVNGKATGQIDLSDKSNGIYMLKVKTAEGVAVRRLIKQ